MRGERVRRRFRNQRRHHRHPSSVCSVSSSTRSVGVDAAAAGGQLTIAINRECQWTATSDVDWIALSPTSGQGDSAIAYSVSANAAATTRRGTISVNDFRVEVTQAAAPCRFSLTPASAAVEPTGGRVTVSVTAQAGCSWTATSQVSWIAIVEGASTQSGNGTLTLRVDANGTTPRSGTVTIANQVVTISQEAMAAGPVPTVPCPLTLSASSQTAGGGRRERNSNRERSGRLRVERRQQRVMDRDHRWFAGTGPGAVQYSVAANPTRRARSGTIAIAGQEFTVSQEACDHRRRVRARSCCPRPASRSARPAEPVKSGSPHRHPPATWTASTATSWLTIGSGASGTGNGTMTFVVAANATASQRSGTLTVAGQDVTVTQAAAGTGIVHLLVVADELNRFRRPVRSGTITVTASAGTCAWTATGRPVDHHHRRRHRHRHRHGPVHGRGQSQSVAAHRHAHGRRADVTVTQAAAPASCTLRLVAVESIGPGGRRLGSVHGHASPGSCAWTVTGAPAWVTITAGATRHGQRDGPVHGRAQSQSGARTAKLKVGGQEFTVTQAAALPLCTFTVAPTSQSVGAGAGNGQIVVTASAPACAWTASTSARPG